MLDPPMVSLVRRTGTLRVRIIAKDTLIGLYETLFKAYGSQNWWPGDSAWEICVGAVLTQNTNWTNVEKAIANLKAAGLIDKGDETSDPAKFADTAPEKIAELIRPSGYFNLKTKRLLNVTEWWLGNVDSKGQPIDKPTLRDIRESLLTVKGVGPETADCILLYCFDYPTFVVDAYTKRVFARHLGTQPDWDYHELRALVMDNMPNEARLFNEFHALIVRVAKKSCLKSKCEDDCPLDDCLSKVKKSANRRER